MTNAILKAAPKPYLHGMELNRAWDLFRTSARSIALTAFLLIAFDSYAQDNDRPVRLPFLMELHMDSITIYQTQIDTSRYVLDESTIQIHPGETLFLEAQVRGEEIISLRSVKQIRELQRTITVTLEQQLRDQEHDHMMLTIRNPFKKSLEGDLSLYKHGAQEWTPPEPMHYPVPPEDALYVTWSEPIVTMLLMDWTLK